MNPGASYSDVVSGTKRFSSDVYPSMQELFEELGQGQAPRVTMLTCSDSRIDPCAITQTGPGDLFVLRNAGNIVPRSGTGGGEIASLEFAIRALKTSHVVVCGHSDCGAMKGLMNPDACSHLSHVSAWVSEAQPALEGLSGDGEDSKAGLNQVIDSNVKLQLANLRQLDFVSEAEAAGDLSLHGWVYEIGTGAVRVIESTATDS